MKKFKKIYVEITNVCNLSCSFCPKTTRKSEFMTVESFKKIAIEVKKHSDYIYLHIKGEPLFHKNIEEIFAICDNLELKICLTTNGTLIKKHEEFLKNAKSLHKIHISLHSFEACEISLSLDEYIENITDFISKSSAICVLRLWNDGGMDDLNISICKKLKQKLLLDFDILMKLDTHIKIKEKCFVEYGQKFDWPNILKESDKENGFCQALKSQIGILVDGTVVACCLDNNGDINLGNIYKNTLQEIYDFSVSQTILKGFQNRKLTHKLCTTCGFINRF